MSYKAILEELCGTALNFPVGELSSLISKEDKDLTPEDDKQIADKLKGHYRNIITQINVTNNKALDEKFKAGQRTKAKEIETLLKEKFGVESDKEGQELVDDIVEQHNKKASNQGKQITEDDVKKHAAFLKMETDFKNKLNTQKQEYDEKINNLTAAQTRKEMLAKVNKEALVKFEGLNPVLSEDPARAAAQKELFLEKIGSYDWEEVDGKFYPMKDGKRVENEFKHALELDNVVETTAKQYFDLKVASDRKAPNGGEGGQGNEGEDKSKQSAYKGPMPKTQDDYVKMMNDSKIPLKERIAINEHWAKQSGAIT